MLVTLAMRREAHFDRH